MILAQVRVKFSIKHSKKIRETVYFKFWNKFEPSLSPGSTCQIECPKRNEQAYCKSSKGPRSFVCSASGDWNLNKKNDCDCRAVCQDPAEQFGHISSGKSKPDKKFPKG